MIRWLVKAVISAFRPRVEALPREEYLRALGDVLSTSDVKALRDRTENRRAAVAQRIAAPKDVLYPKLFDSQLPHWLKHPNQ